MQKQSIKRKKNKQTRIKKKKKKNTNRSNLQIFKLRKNIIQHNTNRIENKNDEDNEEPEGLHEENKQ